MLDALLNFSEYQFKERFNSIIQDLTFEKVPEVIPSAFLLGGQAGSGKTGLQGIINTRMKSNIIVINNDSFKTMHPNFKELAQKYGSEVTKLVTPFSNRMTEETILFLAKQRYNIVIEGTLRTIETPYKTATLLKNEDYDVHLYLMAVPAQLSYLGTLIRFEDMYANNPLTARFTSKEIHDKMVEMLPVNAEQLFNLQLFETIKVYTRDGECIYTNEQYNFSPKAELKKKLSTLIESNELKYYTDLLFSKMKANNRHTKEYELGVLSELKSY